MSSTVLILGGARSGKSRFAQQLAGKLGGDDVLYVATAEARDAEMAARIEVHQASRPAEWELLERPLGIGAALRAQQRRHRVILVDCLTLLVSNVLAGMDHRTDAEMLRQRVDAEVEEMLAGCREQAETTILVSGEVGSGLVPETPLGRVYRDVLGWANQTVAAQSRAVYWLAAGLPVELTSLASNADRVAERLTDHETHELHERDR